MFLLAIVNGGLSKHQKGLLITGIKLQPMFNIHLSFKISQKVRKRFTILKRQESWPFLATVSQLIILVLQAPLKMTDQQVLI